MIDIATLGETDKGRRVIFKHHHGGREVGVLTSWNDRWVFCRFHLGSTAAACDPDQLEFET